MKRKTGRDLIESIINLLLALNLAAAFLLTVPSIVKDYGGLLETFVDISIMVFICEIAIRVWLCRRGGRFYYFFRSDGSWHYWNCFDFIVTFLAAITLISGLGSIVGARMLRMLRLLSAMRLFSRHRRMQLVSEAIIKSIPAIVGTGIYFTMLYSIYAIAGTNLYSHLDPKHFGNVGRTFLFLFQLMTLDDWSEVMYPIMDKDPWAWAYFFSFVLVASYILLNLIVGIIIDSLQQVRMSRELEARSSGLNLEIEQMKRQLVEFQMALEKWEEKSKADKGLDKEPDSPPPAQSHKSRKTSKERKSGKSGKCKR